MPIRVLFVCMGNICRSPTAHAVFQSMVNEAGLAERVIVKSGGTGGWHAGEPPDSRAQKHAKRRGYDLAKLRARQITNADLTEADYVLAMDEENLRDIARMCAPELRSKTRLFLEFAPDADAREVPDPYYGGAADFERVLDLVETAAAGLIRELQKEQ